MLRNRRLPDRGELHVAHGPHAQAERWRRRVGGLVAHRGRLWIPCDSHARVL